MLRLTVFMEFDIDDCVFTCANASARMGRADSLMPAMQTRKLMARARYRIVTAKKGITSSILETFEKVNKIEIYIA